MPAAPAAGHLMTSLSASRGVAGTPLGDSPGDPKGDRTGDQVRRFGTPRGHCRLKPLSRKEFSTTNTELNAIAAPAIIGVSRPNAASGMAAAL